MLTIYTYILLFSELYKKITLPSGLALNTCPAVKVFNSGFASGLICVMRQPYLKWKSG